MLYTQSSSSLKAFEFVLAHVCGQLSSCCMWPIDPKQEVVVPTDGVTDSAEFLPNRDDLFFLPEPSSSFSRFDSFIHPASLTMTLYVLCYKERQRSLHFMPTDRTT